MIFHLVNASGRAKWSCTNMLFPVCKPLCPQSVAGIPSGLTEVNRLSKTNLPRTSANLGISCFVYHERDSFFI